MEQNKYIHAFEKIRDKNYNYIENIIKKHKKLKKDNPEINKGVILKCIIEEIINTDNKLNRIIEAHINKDNSIEEFITVDFSLFLKPIDYVSICKRARRRELKKRVSISKMDMHSLIKENNGKNYPEEKYW